MGGFLILLVVTSFYQYIPLSFPIKKIMIYGTPISFLQSYKGFRLSDPLSSYLFIMAMGAFFYILNRAKEGASLHVSHLVEEDERDWRSLTYYLLMIIIFL